MGHVGVYLIGFDGLPPFNAKLIKNCHNPRSYGYSPYQFLGNFRIRIIIMKKSKLLVFALFSVLTVPSFADNHVVEHDGYDYMAEMIARPWGIVTTMVGTTLYVGVSPITALFMIPKPHDSFERLADKMVYTPFKWTFKRPIGDFADTEESSVHQSQPVAVADNK
jgi:hypothetical protein